MLECCESININIYKQVHKIFYCLNSKNIYLFFYSIIKFLTL